MKIKNLFVFGLINFISFNTFVYASQFNNSLNTNPSVTSNNQPRGLGLIPYSQDQLDTIKKTVRHISKVNLNTIGLKRLNAFLTKHGMIPMSSSVIARPGNEIETSLAIQPSSSLSSTPSTLPDSVDNSQEPWFPPIGDQGSEGSCVSWATTYYQLSSYEAQANGWTISNGDQTKIFSPQFTYNMVNEGQNNGSYMDDPDGLFLNNGAPSLALFPYNGNYTAWPTSANIWLNALNQRIDSYQYVSIPDSTPAGLQLTKQLLLNGHILAFATGLEQSPTSTIKSSTDPTVNNSVAGQQVVPYDTVSYNHAMVIVGYDDNVWVDLNGNGKIDPGEMGAFKLANQWGTGYGNKGFYWIPYDAVNAVSSVAGGPSSGRLPVFEGNIAYDITLKENGQYKPNLVGQFTVNETLRNNACLSQGVSNTTQTSPTVSTSVPNIASRNAFCSSIGGPLPFNGVGVLDMSDIAQSGKQRYYLGVQNNLINTNSIVVTDFRLIDLTQTPNVTTVSSNASITDNSTTNINNFEKFASADYSYNGSLLLNVIAETGGNVSPGPGTIAVLPGSSTTFTMTPEAGYDLLNLFVASPISFEQYPSEAQGDFYNEIYFKSNIVNTTPLPSSNASQYTYTLNNVTAGQNVQAEFNQIPIVNAGPALTVPVSSVANLNGSIQDDGKPYEPSTPKSTLWSQVTSANGGTTTFTNPTSAQTTAVFSKADSYELNLSYSDGSASASSNVWVTVTPSTAINIVQQPVSSETQIGLSVNFTVLAVGAGPLSYQWYKNGSPITGANQSLYVTPLITASDFGSSYYVIVSNGSGVSTTSDTATISPYLYGIYVYPTTNGTVYPSNSGNNVFVSAGGSQTFSFVPNNGYQISSITIDGSALTGTLPTSYTFTNVNAYHNLQVAFSPSSGATPTVPTTYTVTSSVGSNGSITPAGATTVVKGSSLSYWITPSSGYMISSISINGTALTGALPLNYTFSNIASNQTINVTFAPLITYSITASAGANGSISPSGSTSINPFANQSYSIIPNAGYQIASILIDGSPLSGVLPSTYTFYYVSKNHSINVNFAPIPFRILASAGPNGSLSPSGITLVNPGGSQTFTINPNTGYQIAGISINGSAISGTLPTSYTFSNINADSSINVTFAPLANKPIISLTTDQSSYTAPAIVTLKATASESGGSISKVEFYNGSTLLGSSSTSPYSFVWNNVSVGNYALTAIAYDANNNSSTSSVVNISVSLPVFNITVSVGSNGFISPMSTIIRYGGSQIFTLTPNAGYTASLTVDGAAVTLSNNTYTLSNVTSDHALVATFNLIQTAPTVPTNLNAPTVSSSQVSLSWTASTDNGASISYKIFRNDSSIGTSATNSYIDNTVSASQTYSYTVLAYNTSGQSSSQSTALSVTTPSANLSPDGSILNLGTAGNLVTSAGTWTFGTTSNSAGANILLNGRSANGNGVMLLVYNSGHMYTENAANAWYLWNGSGWGASSDPRPKTPTVAPTVPTNLAATAISFAQVNLTWTASTDNGAAITYKIFRNGAQVGTSATPSYSDTGLSPSTTYSYTVLATNASSQNSAQTAAVSVTTPTSNFSPDGSTLNAGTAGSLITGAGIWSFAATSNSAGTNILLNGKSANGAGVMLLVYNSGHMYTKNAVNAWYLWTGSGWSVQSKDPRT